MNKHHTLANIRWSKRELNAIVSELKLEDVKIGHDRKGYFVQDYKSADDPVDQIIRRLQAKVRSVAKQRPSRAPQPQAKRERAPSTGICATVRQWAKDHPDAALKDALDYFKNANSSTVRVQFTKARKAA